MFRKAGQFESQVHTSRKAVDQADPPIRCRNCSAPITHERERIERRDAHRHRFSNPLGLAFTVGCFRTTRCVTRGAGTREHTWFPGYDWTIAICPSCLDHLGWKFECAGDSFYALILDRIR